MSSYKITTKGILLNRLILDKYSEEYEYKIINSNSVSINNYIINMKLNFAYISSELQEKHKEVFSIFHYLMLLKSTVYVDDFISIKFYFKGVADRYEFFDYEFSLPLFSVVPFSIYDMVMKEKTNDLINYDNSDENRNMILVNRTKFMIKDWYNYFIKEGLISYD